MNMSTNLCSLSAWGLLLIKVIVPMAKLLLNGASWHNLRSRVLGPMAPPYLTIRCRLRLLLARLMMLETFLTPWPDIRLPSCLTICLGLIDGGSLATMTLCSWGATRLTVAEVWTWNDLWLARQVLCILLRLTTALLFGRLGLGMKCTRLLVAVLGRRARRIVVVTILLRPRGGTVAVTLMVTLVVLPIRSVGTVVGRMIGLALWLLQPVAILMMLLLRLLATVRVVGVSWYLAQCTVVGLLLSELKPLRLLITGRCRAKGRVT